VRRIQNRAPVAPRKEAQLKVSPRLCNLPEPAPSFSQGSFPVKISPPNFPARLVAGLIAVLTVSLLLTAGTWWCLWLEEAHIHELAPEFTPEKLQGSALQKRAFEQPDLLVFYGSSELVKEMPNNATQFFADYPTGFRVFPVGKPGSTSLGVAQKIAAVGGNVRGKKVAFSISPGWFLTEVFDPSFYAGNFSEMQAYETAFSADLSRDLKQKLARRMLECPDTLKERPFLRMSLQKLAGKRLVDRLAYGACWPLGRLQVRISRLQDHAEVAFHILDLESQQHHSREPRGLSGLNWNELLKRAAKFANSAAVQNKKNEVARGKYAPGSQDGKLITTIGVAREWGDLELLLRTFQELGAEVLLLSIPVEDIRLEVYGVTKASREEYLTRLARLAGKYRFRLADFRDYVANEGFTVDFLDHLSGEGWLYYNKVLDDFFHDRLPPL
jgi:D-alanine transfer protein